MKCLFFILSCSRFPYSMQLVLYLGNDFVASVPVDEQQLSRPGYLGKIKRQLKEQYNELLKNAHESPEFFIVDLPPSSFPAN